MARKKEAIVNANSSIEKTLRPVVQDSIDWENTKNLYVEGDNLEVLKLLQESYLNKIKMIYIDPRIIQAKTLYITITLENQPKSIWSNLVR